MEYLVIALNDDTKKYEEIGTSPTKEVSDFWITGRLNYLHMMKKGHYSFKNVKIIKKEEKSKYNL